MYCMVTYVILHMQLILVLNDIPTLTKNTWV